MDFDFIYMFLENTVSGSSDQSSINNVLWIIVYLITSFIVTFILYHLFLFLSRHIQEWLLKFKLLGTITVDRPEVFTRERLVQRRHSRKMWLEKKYEQDLEVSLQGSVQSSITSQADLSLAMQNNSNAVAESPEEGKENGKPSANPPSDKEKAADAGGKESENSELLQAAALTSSISAIDQLKGRA